MCSVGCRSPELKYPTGVIAPYYDQVCVVGWLITIVFCYVLCFIFIIYHEKYYKISNALEAFFFVVRNDFTLRSWLQMGCLHRTFLGVHTKFQEAALRMGFAVMAS